MICFIWDTRRRVDHSVHGYRYNTLITAAGGVLGVPGYFNLTVVDCAGDDPGQVRSLAFLLAVAEEIIVLVGECNHEVGGVFYVLGRGEGELVGSLFAFVTRVEVYAVNR